MAMILGSDSASAGDNPLGLHPDHVTASVSDIDRATRWYADVLGFRLIERGNLQNGAFQFAELAIQDFGIGLVQFPGAHPPMAPSLPGSPTWLHIVFSVANPDETFERLRQRGADVFTRPADAKRPLSSFLLHDSEGNEIEIVRRKINRP